MVGEIGFDGLALLRGNLVRLEIPGLGTLPLERTTMQVRASRAESGTIRGFLKEVDAERLCLEGSGRTWAEALANEPAVRCGDARCWQVNLSFEATSVGFVTDEPPPDPLPEPDGDCPGSRDEFDIGGAVGQRFPDPNLRNSEGRGTSLYALCGSRAVLLISTAMWAEGSLPERAALGELAWDWAERGGGVYYTIFENEARQPPTDRELGQFESRAGGEPPFRVLKDPNIIPSLYRGTFGALPFAVLLDHQMVVRQFQGGVSFEAYASWMELALGP